MKEYFQIAGIKLEKQKGVYRGRIKKHTEQHAGMNHAIELRQQSKKTMKEICNITGVSQATLYRKLSELKNGKYFFAYDFLFSAVCPLCCAHLNGFYISIQIKALLQSPI